MTKPKFIVPTLLCACPLACLHAGGFIEVAPALPTCVKPGHTVQTSAQWKPPKGGGSASNFVWSGGTKQYSVTPSTGPSTTIMVSRDNPGGTITVNVSATWDYTYTNSKGESKTEGKGAGNSEDVTINPYARVGTITPYIAEGVATSGHAIAIAYGWETEATPEYDNFEVGAVYTHSSDDECEATYSITGTVNFSGELVCYANATETFWASPNLAVSAAYAQGSFESGGANPPILSAFSGYGSVTYSSTLGVEGSPDGGKVSFSFSIGGDYVSPIRRTSPIVDSAQLSINSDNHEDTDINGKRPGSLHAYATISIVGDGYASARADIIAKTSADPELTFTPNYSACP